MPSSPEPQAVELLFAGHHGKPRIRSAAIPCHVLIICKTNPWSCAGMVASWSTEMGTGAVEEILPSLITRPGTL